MILKLRNSKLLKGVGMLMAAELLLSILGPTTAWALTGGPAQPEFASFSPIGATDMVDLASGDMSYNLPLLDVGGYPINMSYSSGVSMDEEASWVGLGWNLSVGQINRSVRGLPDDFKGDKLLYENYLKPNITAGGDFKFTPALVGVTTPPQSYQQGNTTVGVAAMYNNYTGFTMKPSVGVQMDLGKNASVGFNVESGPDGLSLSPNLSIHKKSTDKHNRNNKLGVNLGVAMNSRRGLSSASLSMSHKTQSRALKTQRKTYGKNGINGGGAVGSSISFTDQLYTPTKRVGMKTESFTVNAALGAEIFGGEGQGQVTAYGTVTSVKETELKKWVNGYGYTNTDHAGEYSVLDFNREKDGSFSVNTTNLPLTNYTYDIYSVQGQGVSGTYRPYRNQVGYVYDGKVVDGSASASLGVEVGTGNAFHAGLDIEGSGVNSHSGLWSDDNYILQHLEEAEGDDIDYEKTNFQNVGDLSADRDPQLFDELGAYKPIRIPFEGDKFNRRAVSKFNQRLHDPSVEQVIPVSDKIQRENRKFRNQAIHHLSFNDLAQGKGYGPLVQSEYHSPEIALPAGAKSHHTGEIQIIRNDGNRYVYGLPNYNTKKVESTFAVESEGDCATGLVAYDPATLSNPSSLPNDKYFNRVTTPGYAHAFLLTDVLSADFSDRTGDGPSPDDFGAYTKFSYVRKNNEYEWRVPIAKDHGSFNEGLKTDENDDQGNYVYGTKELLYIDKIETKTHVATFHYSVRKDAKGVTDENGGMDPNQSSYKLDRIALYSIEEYDPQNLQDVVPIKQVHFEYSYSLCPGVPNNDGSSVTAESNERSNKRGKLTLKKVYFTYRNSAMGKYSGYRFNYGEYKPMQVQGVLVEQPDEYTPGVSVASLQLNTDLQGGGTGFNPEYNHKGMDSWGNFMPNEGGCDNLDGLPAPEFSFTHQNETEQNRRAAAWTMNEISLPSGGKIAFTYESDSYAHVQDKATMRMFKVRGAGQTSDGTNEINSNQGGNSDALFGSLPLSQHYSFLYVEIEDDAHVVDDLLTPEDDVAVDIESYLKGLKEEPIYFRFLMNTTKLGANAGLEQNAKYDYVTGYFQYNQAGGQSSIFQDNQGTKYLSIPMELVERGDGLNPMVNPISKATWQFGRKYLNAHVFSAQPNGDTEDIEALVTELLAPTAINNLIEIFTGPNGTLERNGIGRSFLKEKSWVRLMEPDKTKLGGGCRVSEVRISDVWEEMNPNATGYQTMQFGQSYVYELEDGTSSGVATYEPVGNKENPFVQPVFTTVQHLLAPDEDNFIEKPFGESFFPSPQVTYAKVGVASLNGGESFDGTMQVKKKNKTGRVVTEFYTSRDFPTLVSQTKLQAKEDKRELLDNILKLNVRTHFTASQGYVVHLNDMNGKQKAQRVYAEGQEVPISGVDYFYQQHEAQAGYDASQDPEVAKGKLNNTVPVIQSNGKVEMQTIGVEVDVVHDFRENQTKTKVVGVNTNLATFFVGVIPGLVPIPLPDYSSSEDRFRSVSTTKVINTFGMLKETVAHDAGASVYTKNLAWDANTGEVLLTQTVDEFNEQYYNLNYPAHWYYKGMGQAAQNLGMEGVLSGGGNGFVVLGINQASNYFLPGDELYLTDSDQMAWVNGTSGNQIQLIDRDGLAITSLPTGEQFQIVRSGHRNLQSAGIMSITLMRNPIDNGTGGLVADLGNTFLNSSDWTEWRIINAGAVEYSDDWAAGCECGVDPGLEANNPFRYNEKGVYRTKSSRTYLTGRNAQLDVTPRREGFFTSFSPMYRLLDVGVWTLDQNGWTFVAEVTQYSPYGFELENRDALDRHSAAQYGYNNTFPVAVGANSEYREIGFDGFEDHKFDVCFPSYQFCFWNS